jgi:hypothetical protein
MQQRLLALVASVTVLAPSVIVAFNIASNNNVRPQPSPTQSERVTLIVSLQLAV